MRPPGSSRPGARPSRAGRPILIAVTLLLGTAVEAPAQANAGDASPNGAAAAQPPDTSAAIPLADVASEAEAASARLREVQTEFTGNEEAAALEKQLAVTAREIDSRLRETRKILAHTPSLETLARLEPEWHRLRAQLSGWTRQLARGVVGAEGELAELSRLGRVWQQSLTAARLAHAPPDTLRRVEDVLSEIARTRVILERERGRTLSLQNRVAAQDGRTGEALAMIKQAREDVAGRLFTKDSPEIWDAVRPVAGTPAQVEEESRNSLAAQLSALRRYIGRQNVRFILQAALLAAFTLLVTSARRRLRAYSDREPGIASAGKALEMPVAAAFVLSFIFVFSIYPQAPRLLWSLLGATALVPAVLILRRITAQPLHAALYASVFFYLVDQVRSAAAILEFIARLLLLAEMLGAAMFLLWFSRASRLGAVVPRPGGTHAAIKTAASAAAAGAAISFCANALGYVSLATLIADGLLRSGYLAVLLGATLAIFDGLTSAAMCLKPLSLLRVVRRHRVLLRRRARRALEFAALVLWLIFVLDRLLLREPLFSAIEDLVTAELVVGGLRVSLGDILAFVATVWAAVWISRFVRFLLQEDVYSRVQLNRGLPYAISTVAHYLVLLLGFFAAMAALGLDMTKITILAGAFSVGVGLGLQNIFNNFVSGLILLFERPVNVGDMVQIDDAVGLVEHIGIRASVIRTDNGSEIIVPNGKLISDRLTNYTLSSRRRSIELPLAVPNQTDPEKLLRLLEHTAAAHPLVAENPRPRALVVKLGPDTLGVELRAWTERVEDWREIQSDLAIRIRAALAAENIALR